LADDGLGRDKDLADPWVDQLIPIEAAVDGREDVAAPAQTGEVTGHPALGET
jgi:hypothetical protein